MSENKLKDLSISDLRRIYVALTGKSLLIKAKSY